jgi:hypothetical protein
MLPQHEIEGVLLGRIDLDPLAGAQAVEHRHLFVVAGAETHFARRETPFAAVDEDDLPPAAVDHRRVGHRQHGTH